MCEESLERALISNNEEDLNHAIFLTNKYSNVQSKLIKTYKTQIKTIINEKFHESYIINQLNEAIVCENMELIEMAIKLTVNNNFTHLIEYSKALNMYTNYQLKRNILNTIEIELFDCKTISILLNKTDKLQSLINKSIELGISNEGMIPIAAVRLNKINNLINMRNDMRKAVELCSNNAMTK